MQQKTETVQNKMRNDFHVGIRIPANLRAALGREAQQKKTTVSYIVRQKLVNSTPVDQDE